MIFQERQKDGKFHYQVDDVFGKMSFVSNKKLDANKLDQIFVAVFSIKSPSKVIIGEIEELGLEYKFVRKNQWSDIEKEKYSRDNIEKTQTIILSKGIINTFIEKLLKFLINKLNSIVKKYDKQ